MFLIGIPLDDFNPTRYCLKKLNYHLLLILSNDLVYSHGMEAGSLCEVSEEIRQRWQKFY